MHTRLGSHVWLPGGLIEFDCIGSVCGLPPLPVAKGLKSVIKLLIMNFTRLPWRLTVLRKTLHNSTRVGRDDLWANSVRAAGDLRLA